MKQRLWSRSRPFCPKTETIQRPWVFPSTPTMNFRDNARWRRQNDPRQAMLFGFFRRNIFDSYAGFLVYVSRSLSLCSRSWSWKKTLTTTTLSIRKCKGGLQVFWFAVLQPQLWQWGRSKQIGCCSSIFHEWDDVEVAEFVMVQKYCDAGFFGLRRYWYVSVHGAM